MKDKLKFSKVVCYFDESFTFPDIKILNLIPVFNIFAALLILHAIFCNNIYNIYY